MRWRAVWAAILLVMAVPTGAALAQKTEDHGLAPVFGPVPPASWSAVEQLRWRPGARDPDVLEAGHVEADQRPRVAAQRACAARTRPLRVVVRPYRVCG